MLRSFEKINHLENGKTIYTFSLLHAVINMINAYFALGSEEVSNGHYLAAWAGHIISFSISIVARLEIGNLSLSEWGQPITLKNHLVRQLKFLLNQWQESFCVVIVLYRFLSRLKWRDWRKENCPGPRCGWQWRLLWLRVWGENSRSCLSSQLDGREREAPASGLRMTPSYVAINRGTTTDYSPFIPFCPLVVT